MSEHLQQLLEYLDHLDGPASLAELATLLKRMPVVADDVADFIHFSGRQYTRNLVRAGPHSHALVLCWKNGQRSPIHDHRGSNCSVRVLRGTLTESLFDFAPNGLVRAVASRECPPGSILASHDSDMHQISNLQAGDAELVTLHVYSPPLLHMGTYSLTDNERGIEDMFPEFCEAAGI